MEKGENRGKALFKEKMAKNIPESKKHIILKPMVKKEIIVEILKYLEQENRDTSYQDLWIGTSLAVQWLRCCALNTEGLGSIPGQGTKVPYTSWSDQKVY